MFTGAGISTESGIPDFRTPGSGLWTKMAPIPFADFIGSEAIRRESWRRRFDGDRAMEKALPNRGHRAVAQLVADGRCPAVITQNVDGLHQLAGVPTESIIELHGNATYAACLNCQRRFELDALEAEFRTLGRIKNCPTCDGIVKAATISFGQSMPVTEMGRAEVAIRNCDLCLTLGSSLSVYPAAGFPRLAAELGAPVWIINREPTPLDAIATGSLRRQIGPTLGQILRVS